MPVISNVNSRKAGILNDLAETWRQQMPVFEKIQSLLLYNVKYTNLRKAEYVWKESLPFPRKWPYGMPRSYQVFQDRLINCSLIPFELSIAYNFYDQQDDQLGDTKTHLSSAVKRFLQIMDKLYSEYFNGTASLNDELKVTYDGAALFSATDGDGAARLGVTGGNIVTGSGLTVAGVIHDVAAAQRRFMAMRDTKGQVIFTEEDVAYKNLCVIGPPNANEVLQKSSSAEFIKSDTTSNTAESNYQKGTWEYRLNPYLTNTVNLYVVVKHPYWKPFISRMPDAQGIRSIFADFSNSDRARDTNEESLCADARMGVTSWFPGSIVEVNNS